MASGRCLAVLQALKRRIPCDCPKGIQNIDLLRNEGDVKCQDCGHIASQHEDYSKVRPGLVTSSPQGIAFLLGYIFSSLAVADKYNRLDDDSRTGLLTGGAPGGSLDETFCPRINTSELLLQMVIRSRVVYVRGTPACGNRPQPNFSTVILLKHVDTLRFILSPGNRQMILGLNT